MFWCTCDLDHHFWDLINFIILCYFPMIYAPKTNIQLIIYTMYYNPTFKRLKCMKMAHSIGFRLCVGFGFAYLRCWNNNLPILGPISMYIPFAHAIKYGWHYQSWLVTSNRSKQCTYVWSHQYTYCFFWFPCEWVLTRSHMTPKWSILKVIKDAFIDWDDDAT